MQDHNFSRRCFISGFGLPTTTTTAGVGFAQSELGKEKIIQLGTGAVVLRILYLDLMVA